MPAPAPSVVTAVEPVMAAPAPPVVTAVEPADRGQFHPFGGEADARSPKAFPKWIIAGLAILMLSILMFNLRRKPDAEPDIAPVTPAPQAPAPGPTHGFDPLFHRPRSPPSSARGVWRVIAFTFRSRDMAAKKAKQIDDKWPEFLCRSFCAQRMTWGIPDLLG